MKVVFIFLVLIVMVSMISAKPLIGSTSCPVPRSMDRIIWYLLRVGGDILSGQSYLVPIAGGRWQSVEQHASRDAHIKVTKRDVCSIATIVVDGVNVFHQAMLGKTKGVVLATTIGRHK
ncbi:hypothetical protein FXO38_01413 [Capsicum annuum]|nr:hypothetical protein FXO37_14360 [Capsicum annuum]KAF3682134.1 hypothetical protein FXO38_01413 [Capsicum annuum]